MLSYYKTSECYCVADFQRQQKLFLYISYKSFILTSKEGKIIIGIIQCVDSCNFALCNGVKIVFTRLETFMLRCSDIFSKVSKSQDRCISNILNNFSQSSLSADVSKIQLIYVDPRTN